MAKGYRPVRRDQPFLLPPDMREWLPEGHPVWLVISVVAGHLDTSAFHAGRRAGGAGAAGYDPDMLVTVLIWAYANRVTSSRRIEDLCRTDVAFRVICGGNLPDHATIARFRSGFADAAGEFFAQVLVLCARLGMGRLGTVALDGTKTAASASKSASRAEAGLRDLAAGLVAEHGARDQAEDALFGPGRRGDEPPAGGGWRPGRRDERIAAALAGIEADKAAAAAERAELARRHVDAARAGRPVPGRCPPEAGAEVAQLALDRAIAAQAAKIADWHACNAARAAAGRAPLRGNPPVPPQEFSQVRKARAAVEQARARAAAAAERAAERRANPRSHRDRDPARNITDPDSRLMPARGGFIQGYNAQNVTTADGLIIATTLTSDTTDSPWFEPMLGHAETAAALITAHRPASPPRPGPDTSGPDSAPAGYRPGGEDGPGSYTGPIGLLLADAGYCSEDNIAAAGPPRLIATGTLRDLSKTARGAGDPGPPRQPHTTAMAALLATSHGIARYRQRGHIAETPHGNIKHNNGFRQLSVRGKPKASAEWTFACTVHNLFKAISTSHLTPAALASPATPHPHSPHPAPA